MGLFDRAVDGLMRAGQGIATRVLTMTPPTMNTTRARVLGRLNDLYWGSQYQNQGLAPPWDKTGPGSRRVPMRSQRPSVQYDLARAIVDRPTALLFGEGRFPGLTLEPAEKPKANAPKADGGDDAVAETNEWFAAIAEEGGLQPTALTWSRQGGALGSACITWQLCDGEFEFEAHKSKDCTPTFDKRKRSRLVFLEKKYVFKKTVATLDPVTQVRTVREVDYWHRETWDTNQHVVYKEEPVGDGKDPRWIEDEIAVHNFGFVPAYWCKNIDDGDPSSVDGVSLIAGLDDMFEDMDRTLSQKSRAVRYNQDPERVYFGLTEDQKRRVEVGGGASTSLPARTSGADAIVLELQGEGQRIAEEHVVSQRGRALEVSRVVMPDPERLLAASKSGTALRILFAPTLELVGELRQTYGRALRAIFEQILTAARSGALARLGTLLTPPPAVIPAGKVKLHWGSFFDSTPADLESIARAAGTLKAAGILDRETVVRWLSAYFGIKDISAVLDRLDDERNDEYGDMPGVGMPGVKPKPGVDDGEADDTADNGGDDSTAT